MGKSLITNQTLGIGKMWEGNKGHNNEWSDKYVKVFFHFSCQEKKKVTGPLLKQ